MNKVTLVTAFFDIGRKDFKAIPRTNQKYLNDFKFWARMKNRLIVFTDKAYAPEVLNIRTEYGLRELTEIIVIDDITTIEPEILERMQKIRNNGWFTRFRILPNATSNIPIYSYLMLLKGWFMQEASKRFSNSLLVWIDFGYNHGGACFTHSEDFDFEWEMPHKDKIQLFYYQKVDKKPIYETVRRLSDSFMGSPYIIPSHLCPVFWELTKEAMNNLLAVDLYDDDQLLLLMASRKRPDLFDIEESDWFLPIKTYGNPSMRTRRVGKRPKYKQAVVDILNRYKRFKLALRAACITFKDLTTKD